MGEVVTSAFKNARWFVFGWYAIKRAERLGRGYSRALEVFDNSIYAEVAVQMLRGTILLMLF